MRILALFVFGTLVQFYGVVFASIAYNIWPHPFVGVFGFIAITLTIVAIRLAGMLGKAGEKKPWQQ